MDDILFVPSWRIRFRVGCPCSIWDFAMCSGCCCSVVCSAGYFRDAVAPVLFFSPDLSKLIMAQQSESPLCWSSGCVTLTLLCFFFLFFSFFPIISPCLSTHRFREMLWFPVCASIWVERWMSGFNSSWSTSPQICSLPSPLVILYHLHLAVIAVLWPANSAAIDLHTDIEKLTSPWRELIPNVV